MEHRLRFLLGPELVLTLVIAAVPCELATSVTCVLTQPEISRPRIDGRSDAMVCSDGACPRLGTRWGRWAAVRRAGLRRELSIAHHSAPRRKDGPSPDFATCACAQRSCVRRLMMDRRGRVEGARSDVEALVRAHCDRV